MEHRLIGLVSKLSLTDASVVVRAGRRKLAGVDEVFCASRVMTGTKLVVARPQMKYVFMAATFFVSSHVVL